MPEINMIKLAGGIFAPANDREMERLNRFKTGAIYPVMIKQSRNPAFHGKVFAFFSFCFEHWGCPGGCMDEAGQFNVFRNHLTCLAGYYDTYYGIDGKKRIEAKSLSFGSMSQEEFEQFYTAATNAAMKHLFKSADDATFNKLMGFF